MPFKNPHTERYFFITLFFIWLSPVWISSYFLTGDGPTHLYTSRIILDFLRHNNLKMYGYFLSRNHNIDPNWLTNLIQVPLLYLFPGNIAEKLFFTIYYAGFVLGIRFLIKQLNPGAIFLSNIAFLLVWHNLVFKGFLNNTLSIAVWFWIVGYWWKYRHQYSIKPILVQMLLALLGYLSHPIGLVYSALFIGSLLCFLVLQVYKNEGAKAAFQLLAKQLLKLVICFLPVIILTIRFIARRSWSAEKASGFNKDFVVNMINAPTLIVFNSYEKGCVIGIALLCIALFFLTIGYKIREKTLKETDGALLFAILTCITVMYPPLGIMGGLDVPRRLVIMPLFSFLFCAAAIINWNKVSFQYHKMILSLVAILSVGLLTIRLPVQWQLSQFTNEVMLCNKVIEPQSTVMMLNYDLFPNSVSGKKIIDFDWINIHTDCYFGVEKPMIPADNYESNFDYFPFKGKPESNFYSKSAVDGINFENQPPRADFEAYFQKTGIQVDYVLMVGFNNDKALQNHPYSLHIMDQLQRDFIKIYTSPHSVAVLYKNKSAFRNPWK